MWVREGDCPPERCQGACCDHLVFMAPPGTPEHEYLSVRGLVQQSDSVFRVEQHCEHLVNGRCDVYGDRPQLCRDFPSHPSQLVTVPDCGYTFRWKPDDANS